MTYERIDRLTSPAVAGAYYQVPTVRGWWKDTLRCWPVMGEKHEDARFFRFKAEHYHIDRRFVAQRYGGAATVQPLHCGPRTIGYKVPAPACNNPLPDPVWRTMKCLRAELSFPTWPEPVIEMQEALAGARCRRDVTGWICPHRQFSLGSVIPDARGVIICPLHGLQIDAETGVVLPMEESGGTVTAAMAEVLRRQRQAAGYHTPYGGIPRPTEETDR